MSGHDSMKSMYFKITLNQPLIISALSATAGAHQTLDYIPGSVILGLVASKLYSSLTPDEAWTLFHSGQIKFCDGIPFINDQLLAYPVPINLHSYKGESYQDKLHGYLNRLLVKKLFDPSSLSQKQDLSQDNSSNQDRQPVQLRCGYVTQSGIILQPKLVHTLKTAIDAKSGKAAEGQLFGYEAISPGQSYCMKITYNIDLESELFNKLTRALSGKAQLGRSRSAQFGSVFIEKLEAAPKEWTKQKEAHQLTIWLLSDLALESQGLPCLQPKPELIGLPNDAIFDLEKSFLRTRRYSPYNAYRRSYDNERQVISRGSVLRYKLNQPLTIEAFNQLQNGIGLFQESGLGQAVINPGWFFDEQNDQLVQHSKNDIKSDLKEPNSNLIRYLKNKIRSKENNDIIYKQSLNIFQQLCEKIEMARYYKSLGNKPLLEAPSSSQWGKIKSLANDFRTQPNKLFTQLFGDNGAIRNRSGWDLEYAPNQFLHTFMLEELERIKTNDNFSQIVANLSVLGLTDEWQKYCNGELPEHKTEDTQHD